ncbi:MAG: GIY-YIG nuclease family protein [Anaerohalosphaera sp.]|nr:GIY-YIG nuclease family protein [Anaerohalosphaera sp.]
MLYVGVTNDLNRRIQEHKDGIAESFSRQYHVKRLVYFERFGDSKSAIKREKNIKAWKRAWKIKLIEKGNPEWDDVFSCLK